MKIPVSKTADLRPNPRNPRKITGEKLSMLEKSMEEFGDLGCIVFNTRFSHLVGGHQRGKILPQDAEIFIENRYREPTRTGTTAEGHILVNGEKFKYREVDWDETKDIAANIAANKHGGQFDFKLLPDILLELDHLNFDMELVGFDQDELSDILAPVIEVSAHTRTGATGVDEDEVPEKSPSISKLGDLYILGNHKLLCGDATKIFDIETLLKGQRGDMFFTDPPYGMNFQSNSRKEKFDEIKNDDVILDIAPLVYEFLNHDCAAYICSRWDVYPKWLQQFSNFNIKNCVVWNKGGGGMGDLKSAYSPNHEFIIVAHKGKSELRGKRHGDVWDIQKDASSKYVHPTQKPVELAQFAIENHSNEGGTVIDFFGGSGSTLIACEKTNRSCRMMELDPQYVDKIVDRWEKYTGKTAHLVSRSDDASI